MGARFKFTLSKKWKSAFVFERPGNMMAVLIRAHGVDVYFKDGCLQDITNPNNKISIYATGSGNKVVEFFYSESKINIHRVILFAIRVFMQSRDIPEAFYKGAGLSPSQWAEKNKYLIKQRRIERNMRYKSTSDSDRAYYANYFDKDMRFFYELLSPHEQERSERIEAINQLCYQYEIHDRQISRGLCWAEYGESGYRVHELLTDYQRYTTTGNLVEHVNYDGDIILFPESALSSSRFNSLRKRRTTEKGPGFTIVFGDRLPEDYFGDYDYSMYPGGYGPDQAYYGS